MADQAFHDALTELVPNSQLHNVVVDQDQRVLEAKKVAYKNNFKLW